MICPREDKTKQAFEMIEQGVKDVYTSDNFLNYLQSLSKFHNYSLNNTMLILCQYPTASLVAGFNSWNKNFKRHVVKGAKAIKILAPYQVNAKTQVEQKDANGEVIRNDKGDALTEEKVYTVTKFRVVNVFDISQTDGQPLPELTHDLKGTSDSSRALIKSIEEVCEIQIEFKSIDEDQTLSGGAKGYYSLTEDKIVINSGLDDIHKAKTLAHEYAHSLLHKELNKPQSQREIEAESLAFVICNHFGIDTSEYSFVYVTTYAEQNDQFLKQTLLNIQSNAHEMITKLEPIYERNMDMNNDKEFNIDLNDVHSTDDSYLTPVELEYISKGLVEDLMNDVSAMPVYDYLRSKDNEPELGREVIDSDLGAIVDKYADKHPLAANLYHVNDYFEKGVKETIFLRCYLDIMDPNMDRPFVEDSIQRENYLRFKSFGESVLSGDATYIKLKANSSFMDLNIDNLGNDRFAMSHYYEVNGDMMADPDMEITFDTENQLIYGQTFQQDNMNMYQDINSNPEVADDLNKFLNGWLKNIKENNYKIAEIKGDDFSITFDKKGNVIEAEGNQEMINKNKFVQFNIEQKSQGKGQVR